MSLKTVFAIIPAGEATTAALAAFRALPLADNARLVGMHVSPVAVRYGLVTDMVLASYIEAQMEAANEERKTAEAAFTAECQRAGIAFEWRAEKAFDALVSPHAGAMARAAEMIVCPGIADGGSVGRHEVEEVVFASGRPVLALPAGWRGEKLDGRILIAWDGGREAARAAFDALPLLKRAEAVRIVSVQGFLDEPVRQFTPADDICVTLSRLGVRIEAQAFASSRGSVKEELKTQVLDFGADLTVMGCYGHSRFRERILGGVSRSMLQQMPGPLLLSN